MRVEIDFWVDPAGRVRDKNPWPCDGKPKDKAPGAFPRPTDCSAEILAAPARGKLTPFRDVQTIAVGADGFETVPVRYPHGAPAIQEDVLDRMNNAARNASRSKGILLFSPAQIGAARDYRALTERVAAGAVKCSAAFDTKPSGTGKTDFMDCFMADTQLLRRFHDAIGNGIAMRPLRHSPHAMDRAQRRPIPDRALVDMVALQDQSLSDVLRKFGWSRDLKTTKRLKVTLCLILGRIEGITMLTQQNGVDT